MLWSAITLAAYRAALWLYRRSGHHLLCLPVLTGTALVLAALALAGSGYPVYAEATRVLRWLTGPAIIALAVPLYRQAALLRRLAAPLLVALAAGCLVSVLGTLLLCGLMGTPMAFALSLAPKAATMPMAMLAAERAGGVPARVDQLVQRTRHRDAGLRAAVPVHRCVPDHAGVAAGVVGATCESVDAAARKVIDDAGFGDFFIHRTGHGIGMEAHEEPYMVSGNKLPIAAGHAFSVEPGIYLPGKWGMRLEDIVVATDAGPLSMNNVDHSLVILN